MTTYRIIGVDRTTGVEKTVTVDAEDEKAAAAIAAGEHNLFVSKIVAVPAYRSPQAERERPPRQQLADVAPLPSLPAGGLTWSDYLMRVLALTLIVFGGSCLSTARHDAANAFILSGRALVPDETTGVPRGTSLADAIEISSSESASHVNFIGGMLLIGVGALCVKSTIRPRARRNSVD